MRLEGIHHITAITADAPRNVDFYAGLLGLRMVKKTVNFDAPEVYHLYYADERGSPGSVLTFFEFPGAAPGRAGDGMVHRIGWRVAGEAALDFWTGRLDAEGHATERTEGSLRFRDFEGLEHELVVGGAEDPPLVAESDDVPAEHALRGFDGVRAYARDPWASARLLEALAFVGPDGDGAWRAQGSERHAVYAYDPRRPSARSRVRAASTTWRSPPLTTTTRSGVRRRPGAVRARPRSSTVSTSGRSTSASRAACWSRSPRSHPGSTSTSRSRASARP
ncbi:MAG: VOC family protein [Thermoleophilaceae bacterium]